MYRLRDLLELAEEQGFRTRKTSNGHWMFYAPSGRAWRGYEAVCISDPANGARGHNNGGGTYDRDIVNLRRAGLKFPEQRKPPEAERPMPTPQAVAPKPEPVETDLATQALTLLNAIVHSAAELEQVVKKMQTDRESLSKLRALLKGLSE